MSTLEASDNEAYDDDGFDSDIPSPEHRPNATHRSPLESLSRSQSDGSSPNSRSSLHHKSPSSTTPPTSQSHTPSTTPSPEQSDSPNPQTLPQKTPSAATTHHPSPPSTSQAATSRSSSLSTQPELTSIHPKGTTDTTATVEGESMASKANSAADMPSNAIQQPADPSLPAQTQPDGTSCTSMGTNAAAARRQASPTMQVPQPTAPATIPSDNISSGAAAANQAVDQHPEQLSPQTTPEMMSTSEACATSLAAAPSSATEDGRMLGTVGHKTSALPQHPTLMSDLTGTQGTCLPEGEPSSMAGIERQHDLHAAAEPTTRPGSRDAKGMTVVQSEVPVELCQISSDATKNHNTGGDQCHDEPQGDMAFGDQQGDEQLPSSSTTTPAKHLKGDVQNNVGPWTTVDLPHQAGDDQGCTRTDDPENSSAKAEPEQDTGEMTQQDDAITATLPSSCTLRVLLVTGTNLSKPDTVVECFVRLMVGLQKACSMVIRCDPGHKEVCWNQEFAFVVMDPQGDTLKVTLLDCKNQNADMGRCQIPLYALQRDKSYAITVEPMVRDPDSGDWTYLNPPASISFILRAEGFGEAVDMAQYVKLRKAQLLERLQIIDQEETKALAEYEQLKATLEDFKVRIEDPETSVKQKIQLMEAAGPIADQLERFEADWFERKAAFDEQRRTLRLTAEEESLLRSAEEVEAERQAAEDAELQFQKSLKSPPLGATHPADGVADDSHDTTAAVLLNMLPPPAPVPHGREALFSCQLTLPQSTLTKEIDKHKEKNKKKRTTGVLKNPDFVEVFCITTTTAVVRWSQPSPSPPSPISYKVLLSHDRGRTYYTVATVTRRKIMLTTLSPNQIYYITIVTCQDVQKTQGTSRGGTKGPGLRKIIHFMTKPEVMPDCREGWLATHLQRRSWTPKTKEIRRVTLSPHEPAMAAALTQPVAKALRDHRRQSAHNSEVATASTFSAHSSSDTSDHLD